MILLRPPDTVASEGASSLTKTLNYWADGVRMIERVYIHNYRCFENFTIEFEGRSSALLIGENGAGKSTFRKVLGIFQRICRGTTRIRHLIEKSDFAQLRTELPMRFEVEVTLSDKRFHYILAFEFPPNVQEARILEEQLLVEGDTVFSRKRGEVTLGSGGSQFGLDWHVVGLPLINENRGEALLRQLKSYFASMILVHPIPERMSGFSEEETNELEEDASNFSSWFTSLLARYPAAYNHLVEYLRDLIPDLSHFENAPRGETGKQLLVKFEKEGSEKTLSIEFHRLSDGEKCFFLSALMIASSKFAAPFFCMWDEPDNHLALHEVGHFVTELRKVVGRSGQFIATSHHPETIRRFSDENTFVLLRRSHLEPTMVRKLEELSYQGDLIEALARGSILR